MPLLEGPGHASNHPGDDAFLLGLQLLGQMNISILQVELVVEPHDDEAPPEAA